MPSTASDVRLSAITDHVAGLSADRTLTFGTVAAAAWADCRLLLETGQQDYLALPAVRLGEVGAHVVITTGTLPHRLCPADQQRQGAPDRIGLLLRLLLESWAEPAGGWDSLPLCISEGWSRLLSL